MRKKPENLSEKLEERRLKLRRKLWEIDPLDVKLCDHGYTLPSLLKLIRESPDNYEFPIKEECSCRKVYLALKEEKEIPIHHYE